ncbi:MAG: SHOCT domain-containing protein [Acidimicrobiia bacterium]
MSARRTSFGKVARERDKKAKAAAKREQRQSRSSGAPDEVEEAPPERSGPELSTPELLQRVEDLHRRYDEGLISFDEYEEQKADLLSRIKLD